MITEDYVSFEVAKLLKDKGFNEATNRYYNAQYNQIRTVSDTFMWHWNDEEFMKRVLMEGAVAIPTLQMTMKWLREIYDIDISIIPLRSHKEYLPRVESDTISYDAIPCKEYEEACEVAIRYCLENLI